MVQGRPAEAQPLGKAADALPRFRLDPFHFLEAEMQVLLGQGDIFRGGTQLFRQRVNICGSAEILLPQQLPDPAQGGVGLLHAFFIIPDDLADALRILLHPGDLLHGEASPAQGAHGFQGGDVFRRIIPEAASILFPGLGDDQPPVLIVSDGLLRQARGPGNFLDFHCLGPPFPFIVRYAPRG